MRKQLAEKHVHRAPHVYTGQKKDEGKVEERTDDALEWLREQWWWVSRKSGCSERKKRMSVSGVIAVNRGAFHAPLRSYSVPVPSQ